MRTNGKRNNPTPPLLAQNQSQRRVKNTDVTRIIICCHVNYYMIESYHNGLKIMYMHISMFLFSGLLQFAVNKIFMFVIFSVVSSMVGCKSNLRAFGCN